MVRLSIPAHRPKTSMKQWSSLNFSLTAASLTIWCSFLRQLSLWCSFLSLLINIRLRKSSKLVFLHDTSLCQRSQRLSRLTSREWRRQWGQSWLWAGCRMCHLCSFSLYARGPYSQSKMPLTKSSPSSSSSSTLWCKPFNSDWSSTCHRSTWNTGKLVGICFRQSIMESWFLWHTSYQCFKYYRSPLRTMVKSKGSPTIEFLIQSFAWS